MRISAILFLTGVGAACSGGAGGLRVPMPDADPTPATTTSDGIAYPTTNIGGRPRSGAVAGQVFPNLTLDGIRSLATIDEPAVVSSTEFYDPSGARYDLLHVVAVFFWCPHCNSETKDLATLASWRREHRVAVLEIAMQGYGSASPDWSDLQKWVRDHDLDFPVVVDAKGALLGQFFPVNAVPLNIIVDPRTMEVLAVDVGEVGDIATYERGFLSGS
jgi:hypothetical protein